MLAILVLSVIAAGIVFTARSETIASYNYRLDTQADYVAKAGIENTVNWLRSNHYAAVSQAQMLATTYYNVSKEPTFSLYSSNSSPVQCVLCGAATSNVQLIGYGSGSSSYPSITNAGGTAVATAFSNDLNGGGSGVRVTGDANHSGLFYVNAYLLSYQTVNSSSLTTCANANGAVPPCPMETWLVTAKGIWTGGSGQSTAIATAEEQAIVQPAYSASFGNALYGYCSVSMSGSAGTCTDAFNSALGPYGGGNPSVASGACDQNVTNVIASGAGVGANGYVSMSSNPIVSGNVTIGNSNPSLIPSTCCSGSACGGPTSGNIQGSVITGAPYVPAPTAPTFPPGFPSSAPSYSGTSTGPATSGGVTPVGNVTITPGNSTYTQPCASGSTCNGSAANPYLISSISESANGQTMTLYGGASVGQPVYYDISSLSLSGKGLLSVSGYVVLNVQTSLTLTGNGIANGLTQAPEAVQINYAGTNAVSIGGNGAMSAVVTAPNASVTLGGGGSSGYMVGSIRALNVSDQGGYPIHYDIQLNRLDGTLGQAVMSSYTRIKQ